MSLAVPSLTFLDLWWFLLQWLPNDDPADGERLCSDPLMNTIFSEQINPIYMTIVEEAVCLFDLLEGTRK